MSGSAAARGGLFVCLIMVVLAPALLRAAASDDAPHQPVYLPIVLVAPRISPIAFTDRIENNTPVNPRTVFEYGITQLYASVDIYHAQGFVWRIEWDYPGGTTGLDCQAIPEPQHCPIGEPVVRLNPVLSYNTEQPLDRGTYHVRFYLNDSLYQQGTAEIR